MQNHSFSQRSLVMAVCARMGMMQGGTANSSFSIAIKGASSPKGKTTQLKL